jgi:hypothetical protein
LKRRTSTSEARTSEQSDSRIQRVSCLNW